jgi:hypothetical protein
MKLQHYELLGMENYTLLFGGGIFQAWRKQSKRNVVFNSNVLRIILIQISISTHSRCFLSKSAISIPIISQE